MSPLSDQLNDEMRDLLSRFLQNEHLSPELVEAERVGPRNQVEETLVSIWAEVLGVSQPSIYDNFFELGGNSVMSVQVAVRAGMAGLNMTADQILERQTIASLADALEADMGAEYGSEAVVGVMPPTPLQQWFFECGFEDAHHYNNSLLLSPTKRLNPKLLGVVVHRLYRHHDSLRLRFHHFQKDIRVWNAGPEPAPALFVVDLSGLSDEARAAELSRQCAHFQRSLNLNRGPLFLAALYDLGRHASQRLLLVSHFLVADDYSMAQLPVQIESAYRHSRHGNLMRFPEKGLSFKAWSERLAADSRAGEFDGEAALWRSIVSRPVIGLPRDIPAGANTEASAQTVVAAVPSDVDLDYIHGSLKRLRITMNEAMLASVLESLTEWIGTDELLAMLEGRGRYYPSPEFDTGRVVGCFRTLFPVVLEWFGAGTMPANLEYLKTQLKAIPNQGVGYGASRYMSAAGGASLGQVSPEVLFRRGADYAGHLHETRLFKRASEYEGPRRSPKALRPFLFEICGELVNGRPCFIWTFSADIHKRETVAALAERTCQYMKQICEAADELKPPEPNGIFQGV